MQNGEFSFTRQFKEDTPFWEYYRKMVEEKHKNPESEGNWGNWRSCLRYLEIYCDEKTTFKDITPEFINGFKDFLNNVEKDTVHPTFGVIVWIKKKKKTAEQIVYLNNHKQMYNYEQQFSISCLGAIQPQMHL